MHDWCDGCGIALGTRAQADAGEVGRVVALFDEDGALCELCAKGQETEGVNRCKGCGYTIHPSEDYCGECMCEEDSI